MPILRSFGKCESKNFLSKSQNIIFFFFNFFIYFFKPRFQVFSLACIFYFYFHVKRFAHNLPRIGCSFHVGPPWNKRSRLYGGKVMKKKGESENIMLCRLDKYFKRYDIKHYLFIQPTDLIKECFVLFFLNCPLRFSV